MTYNWQGKKFNNYFYFYFCFYKHILVKFWAIDAAKSLSQIHQNEQLKNVNYSCKYRDAVKFVNLLEFSIFLHKYDPKHNQIFTKVLKVDKENPIKQMRQTNLKNLIQFVKHGGSIMAWACFATSWPGPFAIIDGTMNSELYQQILKENIRTSI